MTRKPSTTPETNHSHQGLPGQWKLPTLRPLGPVPADRDTDWLPLKDAVHLLSPFVADARGAAQWLLRHITSGEVAITCRLLTYRRYGTGLAEWERHEWPGSEARLAEQIEQALTHPLSGFRALSGTADLEWLDVTGEHTVQASMSFPHVDRDALISFFPALQSQPTNNVTRPKRGRRPKHEQALRVFCSRLRAGKVHRKKADEARAIYAELTGSEPATPETIAEVYLPEYHRALIWGPDSNATNGLEVAEKIEADLSSPGPD